MGMVKDTFHEPMFLWTLAFLVVMLIAMWYLKTYPFLTSNVPGVTTPIKTSVTQKKNPPKFVLKDNVDYQAVISTDYGLITLDLLEDIAPNTVNNFVALANDKFYNGLTWHRIVKNILIQGGDPQGNGKGGPGYYIKDEINPKAPKYGPGVVGMANAGPNTNGSQFFIIASTAPRNITAAWDGKYTVFAIVIGGQKVVDKLANLDTSQLGNKAPKINYIKIVEKAK